MSGHESSSVNNKETEEKFPKLSRIEFLQRLEEADRVSPRNTIYRITDEQLEKIGFPTTEVEIQGRVYNPIKEAIERSRGGNFFSVALATERAWEYYNSLTT